VSEIEKLKGTARHSLA